ncbi:MAG TPA: hypothetical protein VHO84_14280 [Syntrophorhabdaceae bacterium]|nr:hypothetical protein [Syntrophorhabdaceae bacterium]
MVEEKMKVCLLKALRYISKGLWLGLLVVSFVPPHVAAAENTARLSNPSRSLSAQGVTVTRLNTETLFVVVLHPKRANFEQEYKSREARHMADWVVDSGDNNNMPFVIVDKLDARVFVFDADGQIRGASPALLGLARGDNSVPGIGDRELSDVRPEERTTPAGRFIASLGYNFNGKDVLWVDYNGAVSLHRVITTDPAEHRLQRLATPTPLDNRISYGCINVPVKFYDTVVRPAFAGTNGIVYVLPETHSNNEFFAYYDVS